MVFGVPYDGGTTYQPGARLGPYHVRRVSALVQGYHPHHQVDVFSSIRVLDGGNVASPPFNAAATRELVMARTQQIVSSGATPFVVGGDHSISLPVLRALHAKHGPVAVVHVDAHLDTSSAETWGEEYHHGTPIRHAIQEGLIARGLLFQLGIRGSWGASDDDAVTRSFGGTICGMTELAARGISSVVDAIRRKIGSQKTYLSIDIDAVDPAFAPGTGTPVPGGLSSREALQLVQGLAGVQLVGMDLVEVAPPLDHADITSHLAAHLVYEGLSLLALQRRG